MTPRLALNYSSGAGSSPYGYGWDLPIGRIERSTKRGTLNCATLQYQNDFVLSLPGVSLEFVRDSTGKGKALVEESFLRIEHSSGTNTWFVWDKSGTKYTFGDTPTTRTGRGALTGILTNLCNTNALEFTFSWALTRIESTNGNRIDIGYLQDPSEKVPYPDTVRYGGHTATGHKFEVAFVWSYGRPVGDEPVNAAHGFRTVLKRFLDEIVVRNLTTAGIVRRYRFTHAFQTGAPGIVRMGRQTFLTAVTLYDAADQALARYDGAPASTTFFYHENRPEDDRFGFGPAQVSDQVWLHQLDIGRSSDPQNGTSNLDIFDINGDGFLDWVKVHPDCGDGSNGLNVRLGNKAGFESASSNAVNWATPICIIRIGHRAGTSTDFDTYLDTDIVDLDGDSIPDFVDTRSWTVQSPYWRFYRGYVQGNAGGGFHPPVNWPSPMKEMRDTYTKDNMGVNGTGWGDAPGSVDQRDLIDMTNDGLLDLVVAPLNDSSWDIYINTGSGFEHMSNGQGAPVFKSRTFDAALPALRWTQGDDEMIGLYDMNGDGLPDQVLTDRENSPSPAYLWVYLNDGDFGVSGASFWQLPPPVQGTFKLRRIINDDISQQLMDINGDGLLDLVSGAGWLPSNPYWKVALNRGSGFSAEVFLWKTPFPYLRTSQGGATQRDTIDMDGDGLVDHVDFYPQVAADELWVYHNRGGAWCASTNNVSCATTDGATEVIPNPNGIRPDLLVEAEDGIGGETVLEYRPSTDWNNGGFSGTPQLPFVVWTLTRIERHDGMCLPGSGCLNGGSHMIGNDIIYAWGYFDRVNRQFRGFGLVETRSITTGAEPKLGTLTAFHQAAALSGKTIATYSFDASGGATFTSKPLGRKFNTWECVHPVTQNPITCPTTPNGNVWIRLRKIEEFVNSHFDFASFRSSTTENHAWHQCGGKNYGNVSHTSKGDPAASPRVHVHTEYFCKDDGAGYVVDKASHVWTSNSSDTARLEEKWFFYDFQTTGLTQGNLTRTESWLAPWTGPAPSPCTANAAKQCVKLDMDYDVFGNVISVTDHLGRSTQTTYDTGTHIYPSVVTSPSGLRKASAYDPACGTLLWESIPYAGTSVPNPRRRLQYDTFCRLEKVALPDEDINTAPNEQYFYELGYPAAAVPPSAARPSRLIVFHREPNSALGVLPSYSLHDGMGRLIQEYRFRVVDGQSAIVATSSEYGANGRVARQYAPFIASTPDPLAPVPQGTGSTFYSYDALARVTQVTNPDGSSAQSVHTTPWQTTRTDECYAAAGCTGGKTLEIRDALGRIIERQDYTEPNSLQTRTVYTYDELGRLLTSLQGETINTLNPATYVSYVYDTLGRGIEIADPDSGTWTYRYDVLGNVVVQDDPKAAQHLQYCYDSENRIARACRVNSDFGGTLLSCTGSCPGDLTSYSYYVTAPAGQDRLGRLNIVSDSSGSTAFQAYDLRGRLLQETKTIDPGSAFSPTSATTHYAYDAANHLTSLTYPDGERVDYLYDSSGQIRQVRSATHHLDYLVDLTYDRFGRARLITHGNGTVDTRSYHNLTKNYRLASIDTKRGSDKWLDYRYTAYSAHGLLTQLTDSGPKGTGNQMDNTATSTYDGRGRLVQVAMPKLGAPLTYAYDYLGNITEKESRAFTYAPIRPHTVTNVGSAIINHDANGNRLGNGAHVYTYDYLDRLKTIEAGNHDIELRYDHAGWRVAEILDGNDLVVYYSKLMEASAGWITKYYYAGDFLIASQRKQSTQFAALPQSPIYTAAAVGKPALVLCLRPDIQLAAAVSLTVVAFGLLAAPWRTRRVVGIRIRHGHAVGVAVAFAVTSLPWPVAIRPAEAQCPGPPPIGEVFHYHVDHLGSTQLITTSTGAVQQWVRYLPYGEIWGRFNSSGAQINSGDERFRREFTGYESEFNSGLQYAGARFYDPDLGLFLTHDPARQFPNPYAYGPWSPFNGTDPNGTFWTELIIAAIVGAVVSASVNTIIAAAQGLPGSQIAKAAAKGAVTGAVGVGLGVIAAGVGMGLGAAAGTLPADVGLQQAMTALGEVAYRSAFSTTIANAAGQTASAAGAPDGAVIAASVVAGYLGSFAYDQAFPALQEGSVTDGAGKLETVSNTKTHSSTEGLAVEAGYTPEQAAVIAESNLAQDRPWYSVFTNQHHFDYKAIERLRDLKDLAPKLSGPARLETIGGALHYLQDARTLGHLLPGTSRLAGPFGAPFRFLIHQTLGGEVFFRESWQHNTLQFLQTFRNGSYT